MLVVSVFVPSLPIFHFDKFQSFVFSSFFHVVVLLPGFVSDWHAKARRASCSLARVTIKFPGFFWSFVSFPSHLISMTFVSTPKHFPTSFTSVLVGTRFLPLVFERYPRKRIHFPMLKLTLLDSLCLLRWRFILTFEQTTTLAWFVNCFTSLLAGFFNLFVYQWD